MACLVNIVKRLKSIGGANVASCEAIPVLLKEAVRSVIGDADPDERRFTSDEKNSILRNFMPAFDDVLKKTPCQNFNGVLKSCLEVIRDNVRANGQADVASCEAIPEIIKAAIKEIIGDADPVKYRFTDEERDRITDIAVPG